MWELSAFTAISDFARRAQLGSPLGGGGQEGVLRARSGVSGSAVPVTSSLGPGARVSGGMVGDGLKFLLRHF